MTSNFSDLLTYIKISSLRVILSKNLTVLEHGN